MDDNAEEDAHVTALLYMPFLHENIYELMSSGWYIDEMSYRASTERLIERYSRSVSLNQLFLCEEDAEVGFLHSLQ